MSEKPKSVDYKEGELAEYAHDMKIWGEALEKKVEELKGPDLPTDRVQWFLNKIDTELNPAAEELLMELLNKKP